MKFNLTAMMGRKQAQSRFRVTMVWLSEVTGISTNKLYALENSKAEIVHLKQLDALCTALSCNVGQLMQEEFLTPEEMPLRLRQSWDEQGRANPADEIYSTERGR